MVSRDEEQELLEAVAGQIKKGRLDRRDFLRFAARAGILTSMMPLLAACETGSAPRSSGGGGGEPVRGGTLVVGAEAEFEPLDPHIISGSNTARITQNHIFESLMQPDFLSSEAPPPFRPGLAREYEISGDGKVYTFHLQEGVKFHDGTDFNAEAVKWNIERFWNQERLGGKNAPHAFDQAIAAADWRNEVSGLERIEVSDAMTVKLHLAHPFVPFLRLLAQGDVGSYCIISPASYEKFGNEGIPNNPVGTGPYKFKERVAGERITIERNTDYWDTEHTPYLDEIIWRPMEDTAARENALRAGEVQAIFAPNPDSIADFESTGFTISQGTMPHIWAVLLNHRQPLLRDRNVRLAIQHAIDREGMARDLLRNTALPGESWISRTSESYDENATWWPYDPEKARQYLEDAGAVGSKITFTTSTSGSGQMQPVQMAEWIQRNLNEAGFEAEIKTFEWVTYLGDFFTALKPEWSMSQMSWGWTGEYWLSLFLDADSVYNVSDVNVPGLGELIDKAHRTLDTAKATELYREADRIAKEEAWWLPVVCDKAPVVLDAAVHDFVHAADWQMGFFGNVWVG